MRHDTLGIIIICWFTFSRRFYPKRLTVHSGYTFFVSMYVCSLGIESTTFSAANALLYPWGFMAQETFISINVENSHALHQFRHTCWIKLVISFKINLTDTKPLNNGVCTNIYFFKCLKNVPYLKKENILKSGMHQFLHFVIPILIATSEWRHHNILMYSILNSFKY